MLLVSEVTQSSWWKGRGLQSGVKVQRPGLPQALAKWLRGIASLGRASVSSSSQFFSNAFFSLSFSRARREHMVYRCSVLRRMMMMYYTMQGLKGQPRKRHSHWVLLLTPPRCESNTWPRFLWLCPSSFKTDSVTFATCLLWGEFTRINEIMQPKARSFNESC